MRDQPVPLAVFVVVFVATRRAGVSLGLVTPPPRTWIAAGFDAERHILAPPRIVPVDRTPLVSRPSSAGGVVRRALPKWAVAVRNAIRFAWLALVWPIGRLPAP